MKCIIKRKHDAIANDTQLDQNLRNKKNIKFTPHRRAKGKVCVESPNADATLYEDKKRRTANSRHFVQNDGTVKAVFAQEAVNYYDEKTGSYEEIDNSLIDTGDCFVNKANSFKVKFNKHVSGGKVFDLEKKDCRVSLFSDALAKKEHCGDNCGCELCADTDGVVLKNVDGNTDIEYLVEADRVKENIIINDRADKYEYDFTLNAENLTVEAAEDGKSLNLKNSNTGVTEFTVPAPFMYDAEGNRSDDVYYEVDEKENGVLSLKVAADKEFINAEGRAFPVVIDPQMIVQDYRFFDFETNNYSGYADYNYISYDLWIMCGGWWRFSTISIHKYLIKNDLIENSDRIKNMKLVLMPQDTPLGNILINGQIYTARNGPYEIDITNLFRNETSDYLMLELLPADDGEYTDVMFYTEGTNMPKLIIDYMLEEVTPVTESFSIAGKATGQLEMSKGVYTTNFTDISADHFVLPLSIEHSYIANSGETNCGTNWRLNLNQKLTEKASIVSPFSDYIYTDETGNQHKFSELYYYLDDTNSKVYISKDKITVNLNGELTYNGNEILKEYYTRDGWKIIPEIKDYINSDLLEQRSEKQKQFEETLKQYQESLENIVLTDSDGVIKRKLFSSEADAREIIYGPDFTRYFFIDVGSALQIRTLKKQQSENTAQINAQRNSLTIEIDYLEHSLEHKDKHINKDCYVNEHYQLYKWNDLIAQRALLNSQSTNFNEQIGIILEQGRKNREKAKNLFKEYVNVKYQLDELLRHTPVNFLKDNNNIVRGFNSEGKLVTVFDAYENYVMVEYDDEGKISNVFDSENRQVAFDYNASGLLSSITDDRGRKVKYTYNDTSHLVKVTFADKSTLDITYSGGNITQVESSNKVRTVIAYDNGDNKPTSITDYSLVSKISKSAETAGLKQLSSTGILYSTNTTTITENDAMRHRYTFDAYGNLTTYERSKNTDVYEYTGYEYKREQYSKKTTTLYNAPGTVTENTTLNQFNKPERTVIEGEKIAANTTLTTIIEYEYDNDHRPVKQRTERRIKVGNAAAVSDFKCTDYYYNAKGDIVRTESYVEGEDLTSGINIQESVYDEKGNVIKTIGWNSLDSSTKFYSESKCAENGKVLADIDESGEHETEYEYVEGTSIVKTEKSPTGSTLAYGRDSSTDQVTAITQSTEDGEANTNNTVYRCGLPVEVKSGSDIFGYEYGYEYNQSEVSVKRNGESYAKLTKITDIWTDTAIAEMPNANGNTGNTDITVTTVTDKEGKPVSQSIGGVMQYENSYRSNGTLQTTTDKTTGYTVTNEYDDANKLKHSTRTVVPGPFPFLSEFYTYSDCGQLTNKSINDQVNNVYHSYTYGYNESYARDLAYIVMPGEVKESIKTDVYGRREENVMSYDNNDILGQYTYYKKVGDHGTNQISSVRYGQRKDGKYVICDGLKYKYDGNGNITEVYENGSLSVRYAYDKLNRLIREDNKKLKNTYLYSYDNNGNILSKKTCNYSLSATEKLSPATEKNYLYNGDRLEGYDIKSVDGSFCGDTVCGGGSNASGGTNGFTYDDLGNSILYKDKTLVWQKGRQLKSYDDLEFTYDGYGRRISKGSTQYLYDNSGKLLRQSNGTNTLEFIYDTSGIAGFIHNSSTYLYRKNIQGDVTHIYGLDGNEKVCYTYDAWGNCLITKDTDGLGEINPIRYRSYYFDHETGLYYLQTRYYDSTVGRFINADDISYLAPGSINGLNLFAYCGNNPVMRCDPTGHNWWEWLFGVVISIASFVGGVIATFYGQIYIGAALMNAGINGIAGMITNNNNGGGVFSGFFGGYVSGFISGLIPIPILDDFIGTYIGNSTTKRMDKEYYGLYQDKDLRELDKIALDEALEVAVYSGITQMVFGLKFDVVDTGFLCLIALIKSFFKN